MKAIVHQTLGDVFGHHATGLFQAAQIQNALVRNMTCFAIGTRAGVQGRVVVSQAAADVIGGQNSRFGGMLQTFSAHHAAIHPADGQHGGIAQRRSRDSAHAIDFQTARRMTWQIRHQIFHHANRTDTRAAAAVRDAESFVQIEVAHIAAKFSWGRHTHQGIHVGAVHVHAAAMLMHQLTKRFDLRFKHPVRAGVSDHDGSQVGTVLFTFGLQVGHVDVALCVTCSDHHLHAHHLGAGRVGAMRA